MFFVSPYAVYPRLFVERVFKGLYQLGTVSHVISFIVVTTHFFVRQELSFTNDAPALNGIMAPGLAAMMQNCTYNGVIQIGTLQSKTEVTDASLPAPLIAMAQHIVIILVVQFFAIVNNALGMANYSAGSHHLRLLGVHVPLYHIMTTLSFVYCIVLIVLVWVVYPVRMFYTEAISTCVRELNGRNSSVQIAVGYDGFHIFETPLEWSFAAAVVNIFIYTIGAMVLTAKSMDPATVLLSESELPWETRGVACKTDKAALRIHTAAREAILREARAAMSRGEEVRIARGYALMTEAAYQAQVNEMRQHFAERMKEQQFEHMRTYFEHESDLDEGGLHWRQQQQQQHEQQQQQQQQQYGHNLSQASKLQLPPATTTTPDVADQFVDVEWSPHYAEEFGFADVLDEREHGGYIQNQYDYLLEADDGGELPCVSPLDTGRHHHHYRLHKGRHNQRHYRKRNCADSGTVGVAASGTENGAVLQPTDDEVQGEFHGLQDDGHPHRRRREHRRRHHSQNHNSHPSNGFQTFAEGNAETEMDCEMMPSPLDKADEL